MTAGNGGAKQPLRILVVANETVGGGAPLDAGRKHAEQAHEQLRPFHVTVVCPQNQPKAGYVVYDETVRTAAENRLSTTLAQLREVGIEADGEIMDPDPYNATMDAFGHYGADEIIISTHPETRSGWLRRDLIARARDPAGAPRGRAAAGPDGPRARRRRRAGRARGRGPRRRPRRRYADAGRREPDRRRRA